MGSSIISSKILEYLFSFEQANIFKHFELAKISSIFDHPKHLKWQIKISNAFNFFSLGKFLSTDKLNFKKGLSSFNVDRKLSGPKAIISNLCIY